MSQREPGSTDHDITLPSGLIGKPVEAPTTGRPSVFSVKCTAATHVGLVRDHNEDDYAILDELGVFVVADGMGGHNAGKVASGICVSAIRQFFQSERVAINPDDTSPGNRLSEESRELVESLKTANRAIFEASLREREYAGMGTTAVGLRVFDDRIAVAHAGDSRCYMARDGRMAQVTIDHSLVNFLYDLNREFEAQVAEMHMSNVIMRAVGLEPDAQIDVVEFIVRHGDRLMVCSDGLSDLVPDERIAEVLYDTSIDAAQAVEILIADALEAGGRDNVTVMIVDVADGLDADTTRRDVSETQALPVAELSLTADHAGAPDPDHAPPRAD